MYVCWSGARACSRSGIAVVGFNEHSEARSGRGAADKPAYPSPYQSLIHTQVSASYPPAPSRSLLTGVYTSDPGTPVAREAAGIGILSRKVDSVCVESVI